MFVFYYSVLSEVTPPTALAAVGAAAITGGRVVPTMWQTLQVRPARVPGPDRVRAHRAGRAPARPGLGTGDRSGRRGRPRSASPRWRSPTGGWLLGVGPAGPVARTLSALAGLLLLYLRRPPSRRGRADRGRRGGPRWPGGPDRRRDPGGGPTRRRPGDAPPPSRPRGAAAARQRPARRTGRHPREAVDGESGRTTSHGGGNDMKRAWRILAAVVAAGRGWPAVGCGGRQDAPVPTPEARSPAR